MDLLCNVLCNMSTTYRKPTTSPDESPKSWLVDMPGCCTACCTTCCPTSTCSGVASLMISRLCNISALWLWYLLDTWGLQAAPSCVRQRWGKGTKMRFFDKFPTGDTGAQNFNFAPKFLPKIGRFPDTDFVVLEQNVTTRKWNFNRPKFRGICPLPPCHDNTDWKCWQRGKVGY